MFILFIEHSLKITSSLKKCLEGSLQGPKHSGILVSGVPWSKKKRNTIVYNQYRVNMT